MDGDIEYYVSGAAITANVTIPADPTPDDVVRELESAITGSNVVYDGFGFRVELDGLSGVGDSAVASGLGLSFEAGATLVVPVGSGEVPTLPGSAPEPTVLFSNNATSIQLIQAWVPEQATAVDNVDDGSYYFELESDETNNSLYGVGVFNSEVTLPSSNSAFFVSGDSFAFFGDSVYHDGSRIASATYTAGDRLGFKIDMADGQATMTAYVNGAAVTDAIDIDAAAAGSMLPTVASGVALITGYFSADTIMFLPAGAEPWDTSLVEGGTDTDTGTGTNTNTNTGTSIATPTSLAECLTAINDFDDDWYGLVLSKEMRADTAQVIEIAEWIEARVKVFGYTSNNPDLLDATVTDDIASQLKLRQLRRTMTTYSSSPDEYPSASILGRAFTVNFNQPDSTITLMYKSGPGITVEKLTGNQKTISRSKCVNAFNCVGEKSFYDDSSMANGAFFDEVHGIDWLQNAIETQVCGFLLSRTTKVPYTDRGVAAIEQQVRFVLDEAVRNGLIAPGETVEGEYLSNGYSITSIPVAEINQSDVDRRFYGGMSFVVLGAGAIHRVEINGVFER